MNLYPYQEKAVAFIKEKKRVYLALDLGMGKTLTSIASQADLNVLLVAEKNEIVNSQNFKKEVEKHFNMDYFNLRDEEPIIKKGVVCGINPDGIVKIDDEIIKQFDAVIIDEATMAKTTTTDRFKKVHKITQGVENLVLLSGTPMMNGAAELYAPLLLLEHPMVAGKGAEGRRAFEIVFAGGHSRKIRNTGKYWQDHIWWAKGANNVRELRWLIRDNFFFMLKGETGLFKKKVRTIKRVPMTLEWLAEYTQAWDRYINGVYEHNAELEALL